MASGKQRVPQSQAARALEASENRAARPVFSESFSACSSRQTNCGEAVDFLIERQILPRLLVAHSTQDVSREHKILATEAAQFADLPLSHDADDLLREVEAFIARGASIESIYIDILAPSARTLGEHWENDTCDFVDVTMGLWRLQEVMRELATRFPSQLGNACVVHSALFTPFPGDQHSFGALMVEEIFARAGWDSEALIDPQRAELLHLVAERPFDLVGLTVSNDCPSGALSSLVTAIRSVSKNRATKIILGGRAINANPGLASLVGADGTATDARSALILANRIVTVPHKIDVALS